MSLGRSGQGFGDEREVDVAAGPTKASLYLDLSPMMMEVRSIALLL